MRIRWINTRAWFMVGCSCYFDSYYQVLIQCLGTWLVQSLSHVQLFATPWTAAHQASLSSVFWSLLKLVSSESVMPSNHLILCHPLLLLPFSVDASTSVQQGLCFFPSTLVLRSSPWPTLPLCRKWLSYLESGYLTPEQFICISRGSPAGGISTSTHLG